MTKNLFSARFPNLPTWEQLLSNLHSVPGDGSGNEQVRLDLLQLAVDPSINLSSLLAKICVILPKVIPIQAVAFIQAERDDRRIIASNQSAAEWKPVINDAKVQKLLETRNISRGRFDQSSTKDHQPGQVQHLAVYYIGLTVKGPLVMLTASVHPYTVTDLKILRIISGIVKLRARNLLLTDQVHREAERLATLTHHLSEGMIVLDENLTVTLWNLPLERLTGFSAKDAIGQPYHQVLRRADSLEWLEEVVNNFKLNPSKNIFLSDFQIITKTNKRKWVSVSGSFSRSNNRSSHIPYPAGRNKIEIEQVFVIVRDISHFKELEMRKNEFISIATHELRTPITAVMGYLSLLSREKNLLSERQNLYLARATEATNRLVRLAEDLLRVVQVEEDRLTINLGPVKLYPLLQKIVRDFSARAEQKSLSLKVIKPSFPTQVIADIERVEQVFANVVDNAIKYTTQGSITISFEEQFERSSGRKLIKTSIRDTGIGISAKKVGGIFEKFQRSHNPEQVRELGAGLGLFIVRSFVTKQGGKIGVSSRPGRGTTFYITLPAGESKLSRVRNRTKLKS